VKLIAIGCSWGGLAALTVLLDGLPADLDAAVVVAQHRAPEVSQLEHLLHERSQMPVQEVDDKDEIRARTVFLAPPAYHTLVEPGRFALSTDAPVQYARPSLDVLFESAADAYGPDCIGVVLTGASADGAAGLNAICEAGGVAIVQEPESAERAEMPAAALDATPSAQVLPLEEIPAALTRLIQTGTRS
jgi:two-component system, chemotaxis family, protein-glutamate methylesterase/glutaminase